MPKYQLEEFKEWLDKKSLDNSQKEQWENNFANCQKTPDLWEAAARGIANGKYFYDWGKFLKAWQEEVDSRIGRVKELGSQLTQTKDLNQKLQTDNKDLLKDIQNYKQKIANLEQNLTTLQTQLKTQQASTENLTQALTQQKSLWTQHIQQTKSQIKQEIALLKGVLA